MISKSDLTTIALFEHAMGMAAAIPEMESFPAFYLKTLPPARGRLIARYLAAKNESQAEMLELFENDSHPSQS